jgi:hypothetical protein
MHERTGNQEYRMRWKENAWVSTAKEINDDGNRQKE